MKAFCVVSPIMMERREFYVRKIPAANHICDNLTINRYPFHLRDELNFQYRKYVQ